MLSFITYRQAPEQVEIVVDAVGIDELISYLESIKSQKDHMHLIIDSELDDYPLSAEAVQRGVVSVKHVRLEYASPKAPKLPE
ncbi:hypothetical protein [Hymenobacter sp. B81]|uniref:hypothetical protein n=1 Tax=Hymenobacter sp. B81 TaxID=3344878 RepID=UPI0037DD64A7